MERVLLNKVTYLTKKQHWDVVIVTTDQKGRPTFYPFPKGVRMIDLGINYSDDNGKGFFAKRFIPRVLSGPEELDAQLSAPKQPLRKKFFRKG